MFCTKSVITSLVANFSFFLYASFISSVKLLKPAKVIYTLLLFILLFISSMVGIVFLTVERAAAVTKPLISGIFYQHPNFFI